MTARWRSAAGIGALLIIGLITGCSLPPSGCNLSIGAIEDPSDVKVGDTVPADARVLVSPEDIDPLGGAVMSDESGPSIVIRLRPDGASRIAAHTRTHVGDALVVSIAGNVISVPLVSAPIEDGAIQLSGPSNDAGWLARFAGCVPAVIIPPA